MTEKSVTASSSGEAIPIRQLILGRYRILFIVEKRTVTIVLVRGSYVDQVHRGEPTQ